MGVVEFMRKTIEQRFWEKVDVRGPDECWPWVACTNGKYGQINLNGKKIKAHRLAYHLAHPEWSLASPDLICHDCDNPPCCNESHLWPGTKSDNMKDAFSKGRAHPPLNGINPPVRTGCAHPMAKLTDEQVTWARTQRGVLTQREIGKVLGVTQAMISLIQLEKNWRCVQ